MFTPRKRHENGPRIRKCRYRNASQRVIIMCRGTRRGRDARQRPPRRWRTCRAILRVLSRLRYILYGHAALAARSIISRLGKLASRRSLRAADAGPRLLEAAIESARESATPLAALRETRSTFISITTARPMPVVRRFGRRLASLKTWKSSRHAWCGER